jgi:hypothetical protein
MDPRRRALLFLSVWLLGASGMAASLAWSLRPLAPVAQRPIELPAALPFEMVLPNDVAGVREPAALPAAEADLADGELVVGVTEGGHSRAYPVQALSHGPPSHVVNDVLDGVPVSVTHCDLYHCTRAFTGGAPGEPLDLAVGGVTRGGLILRAGGHSYRQDSGAPLSAGDPPFPYAPHPAATETWGEWRHEHPDTDVYVAVPEEATPPPSDAVPSPLPFDLPAALAALASVVSVGIAPLLIGCVTVLAHLLLAYLFSPVRRLTAPPGPPPEATGASCPPNPPR